MDTLRAHNMCECVHKYTYNCVKLQGLLRCTICVYSWLHVHSLDLWHEVCRHSPHSKPWTTRIQGLSGCTIRNVCVAEDLQKD